MHFQCIQNHIFIDYFTMLHMKQLNNKNKRFPRSDKILVIQAIAEVYGEGNERQLCEKIGCKGEVLHMSSEYRACPASLYLI